MVTRRKGQNTGKAQLVKIEDIHIPKKDYPKSPGHYPPDSPRFEELKVMLRNKGQLIPVFINADKLLIQGHYRLWAMQALGESFVKAITVEDECGIDKYFDNLQFSAHKAETKE